MKLSNTTELNSVLQSCRGYETFAEIIENLEIRAFRSSRGALIGPAWSKGNWMLTYDPDPLIPWSKHLAEALSAEWGRLDQRSVDTYTI
jgi:hypothetical protein